jgi:hypothetical protein
MTRWTVWFHIVSSFNPVSHISLRFVFQNAGHEKHTFSFPGVILFCLFSYVICQDIPTALFPGSASAFAIIHPISRQVSPISSTKQKVG